MTTVKVVGFTVKVCDRSQPQCTRRITGEFNDQNLLERTIPGLPTRSWAQPLS
jgi:hypothetical protein